MVYSTYT